MANFRNITSLEVIEALGENDNIIINHNGVAAQTSGSVIANLASATKFYMSTDNNYIYTDLERTTKAKKDDVINALNGVIYYCYYQGAVPMSLETTVGKYTLSWVSSAATHYVGDYVEVYINERSFYTEEYIEEN